MRPFAKPNVKPNFDVWVCRRLWRAAAVATTLLAIVYLSFVRTVTGQRWENTVLAGRLDDETLAAAHRANDLLDHITLMSLGVAVAVVALIGVGRREYALTAVAVGTISGSLALAELLKRYFLRRPNLVGAPSPLIHNSFPSGHTTIAMGVLFGLLLVVPHRLRGITAGLCSLWASFVGAYTVAAGWHRPSDTIGADLLVLTVASVLTSFLAQTGRIRPADEFRHLLYTPWVTAPLTAVALLGLGSGTVGLVRWAYIMPVQSPAGPVVAYQSGHALSAGAGAAVTLTLLSLLRHVELGRGDPLRSRRRGEKRPLR
jgi:membrane-associated phospholipid phosphatase